MDFKLFAPSYRRPGATTTQRYLSECTLVVAESEADAYRAAGERVWAVPDSAQGNVSRIRNYILDHAGCDNVVILDDDISFIGHWQNCQMNRLDEQQVYEFIERGFIMASEWGVRLWGMNLMWDKGAYRETTPFSTLSPILGPFQAHCNNDLRYDEALPLKEDYDLSLQVLNKYRRVLRFNAYFYYCKQHTNPGGCAAYRTIGREREQFDLLQRKWGSRIVRTDTGASRKGKRKAAFDINPIVRVPINGV